MHRRIGPDEDPVPDKTGLAPTPVAPGDSFAGLDHFEDQSVASEQPGEAPGAKLGDSQDSWSRRSQGVRAARPA